MQEAKTMTIWSEMKEQVEAQMGNDPQRATLSSRAIASVEEGLRHLTGIGYGFEIAPRGTLAALTELRGPEPKQSNPLTIKDAQKIVAPPAAQPDNSFEAKPNI